MSGWPVAGALKDVHSHVRNLSPSRKLTVTRGGLFGSGSPLGFRWAMWSSSLTSAAAFGRLICRVVIPSVKSSSASVKLVFPCPFPAYMIVKPSEGRSVCSGPKDRIPLIEMDSTTMGIDDPYRLTPELRSGRQSRMSLPSSSSVTVVDALAALKIRSSILATIDSTSFAIGGTGSLSPLGCSRHLIQV